MFLRLAGLGPGPASLPAQALSLGLRSLWGCYGYSSQSLLGRIVALHWRVLQSAENCQGHSRRLGSMIAGNFAVFPFLSVLQMLMASGHSGRLDIRGRARTGQLWLREGTIVHACAGQLEGESAMQLLTTTEDGEFHFGGSEAAPGETLLLSGDLALRQLFQEAEAWKPLLAEYSDWSRPFDFTDQWSGRLPVSRRQFQVLRGVERGLTISEMVDQGGLAPRMLLGTLQQFQQAGLIVPRH